MFTHSFYCVILCNLWRNWGTWRGAYVKRQNAVKLNVKSNNIEIQKGYIEFFKRILTIISSI